MISGKELEIVFCAVLFIYQRHQKEILDRLYGRIGSID